MAQQLALADVLTLPTGNERDLWRTDPQRAFEAFIRTKLYTPRSQEGVKPMLPRHYSLDTQRSYAALFGQYVAFLRERERTVIQATGRDVAAFLDALPGRTHGEASIVTRRRAFNVLEWAYAKLVDLGLRRDQPVKPLVGRFAGIPESSPHSSVLLPSQHDALLEHIENLPRETFESARRAALLAIQIGCGVCGDELRRLKRSQLLLDEPQPLLSMDACGLRSEVTLPLSDHTANILRAWCNLRDAAVTKGELLFPAHRDRDEPVGLQTLHRYAVAALAAIGRVERVGAQRVLRASFAVRQLAHAEDEEQVRRWLRLRTDKMIERYKRQVVRPGQRLV